MNTLFYDVFQSSDPQALVAIGPFLKTELKEYLNDAQFWLDGEPATVTNCSQSHRVSTLRIESAVNNPRTLEVSHPSFSFLMGISPSRLPNFKDKNAIFSINRNNELCWINDWVRYHVVSQSVNSVLIFDNASDKYCPQEICDTLKKIDGLEHFEVVSVPFPFGPAGETRDRRDARFLQFGVFELARLRFLSSAKGVLNLDIDELAYSSDGSTVFDEVKTAELGTLTLNGQWVYPPRDAAAPGHFDHTYRLPPQRDRMGSKWAINPAHPYLQGKSWRIHGIKRASKNPVKGYGFLHCRKISTNWSYERSSIQVDDLETDPVAEQAFASLTKSNP